MRSGQAFRIAFLGVLIGIAAAIVAVVVPWLPTSASEQMDRIAFTYWFATVICIAIFALVAAVILYSVFAFRAQPGDDSDGPPIHGHTGLEIAWTAGPAILVTAIGIVSAVVLAQNEATSADTMSVKVTAQQFAWSFTYPDHGNFTTGQLYLPLDRTVKLELTAKDVIHSFWVPEFAQKSDAVPGITTTLVITPTRTGKFDIICTELCGLGHATMRSAAFVVEEPKFAQWVDEMDGSG